MTSTPSPELIIDGKTSSNNIEGTHERVENQVAEELGKLTNEIGKNFYSINENGEVEYDIDLVKRYLETKKDKSYSELLKSQNTAAWIMAVQIALSSVGYDVGKVDGILKNKGAKTSKTVEQIIKFQRDNGLRPDGQPGSKTIKELLKKLGSTTSQDGDTEVQEQKEENDKKQEENSKVEDNTEKVEDNTEKVEDNTEKAEDKIEKAEDKTEKVEDNTENTEDKTEKLENEELITREKFNDLCFKSELSDKEMKQVVAYANEKGGSWLALRITTIKNQNQLNELSKIKSALFLHNVPTMTDEQLKGLCNIKRLGLGLTKITSKQAEIISNSSIEKLEMFSLNGKSYKVGDKFSSMSNDIVNKLSEAHNLKELYITDIRLTQNQKEVLKDKIIY